MRVDGNGSLSQLNASTNLAAGTALAPAAPATVAPAAQPVVPGFGASSFEAATAPQTPLDHAQTFFSSELGQLENAKYTFSPKVQAKVDKINAERSASNAKVEQKLSALAQQRATVQADTKLSPKKQADQLKKLDKKIADQQKKLKPTIDLASATGIADAVMNDPNIAGKDKKGLLDKVRKQLGLSGGDMHKLVTDPLSHAYGASKKRVDGDEKTQTKALDAQLKSAEKVFGKKSPQVQALEAQQDAVKKLYGEASKALGDDSKQLHGMFKPRGFWGSVGHFFSSVGKGIGKVLDKAMPLISMIPGVGQIAGGIYAGVKAITAAVKGHWGSMLSSLGSALPGIGGAIGGTVGKVLNVAGNVINDGEKGLGAVSALEHGDLAGALAEGASLASGINPKVANVLSDGAKVAGVVQDVASGNYGAALSQAADFLPKAPRDAIQQTVSLLNGANQFVANPGRALVSLI